MTILLSAPPAEALTVLVYLDRVTVGPGGPAREEQAALLYNDWLLDVPKLLDIAVLYGRDNSALVQQLMQQVTHR